MITKHLGHKIAILSLLILTSGISASAQRNRSRDWDGYPNWGGSFDLRQTALNAGYNEGSKEGRNDRSHNRYHEIASCISAIFVWRLRMATTLRILVLTVATVIEIVTAIETAIEIVIVIGTMTSTGGVTGIATASSGARFNCGRRP